MKRKDRRNKKLMILARFLVLFCSLLYAVSDTYGKGIVIDSLKFALKPGSPASFSCPGSTIVALTIHHHIKGFSTEVQAKRFELWDADPFLFRGPDDPIDSATISFRHGSPNPWILFFDLWCDSCCPGGVKGRWGHSNEQEAEIYGYHKKGGLYSCTLTISCNHPEHALGTIPDKHGCVGDTVDDTFLLRGTLASVQTADFHILYDSALFSIVDAEIVDSALAPYQVVDYSVPGIISFYSQLPGLADIYPGTLATFTVNVSESASYGKTQFEFSTNSVFLGFSGDTIGFDWDIGNFVILPADSTPPNINEAQIVYNPNSITGMPGAITDDYDSLQYYLHAKFYDDEISQWRIFPVNSDGSFLLDEIWQPPSSEIDFIAFDGCGNEDTAMIMMQSYWGYVLAYSDTIGRAGDTVDVTFYSLNWSYSTHTYDLQVTDSEGWNLSPPPASVVLDSMQYSTITISAVIPPNSPVGTINWITMTSTSQADSTITDSDSLYIEVTAEPVIPTLSEWGMMVLALLLLAAGTVAVVRRRKAIINSAD